MVTIGPSLARQPPNFLLRAIPLLSVVGRSVFARETLDAGIIFTVRAGRMTPSAAGRGSRAGLWTPRVNWAGCPESSVGPHPHRESIGPRATLLY